MLMCRCAVCGLWSPEAGLAMTPDTRWELRADLTGLLLRAAATTDPPFVTTIAEAGAGGWSPDIFRTKCKSDWNDREE